MRRRPGGDLVQKGNIMGTTAMGAVTESPVERWRDRKRHLWLVGLVLPTALPVSVALAWVFVKLGWNAATPVLWWVGPLLLYVLLPILDLFLAPTAKTRPTR